MGCVAVIPARRAEATIAATLESLRLGNADFIEAVVVVTGAGDPTATVAEAWRRSDPAVHVLSRPGGWSAGAARNAGTEFARRNFSVSLLLFVDADCRLAPRGAALLARERALRGAAAISARVITGGGATARTRHMLEFKEAASRRPAPAAWLPPSTTMLCEAAAFDLAGGFPDFWPGEDLVFAQALRRAGASVLRSDAVETEHRHPPGIARMLRHQRHLGATAARARLCLAMPGSWFARGRARACLLLPARALRLLAWQAVEGPRALARAALLSPLLAAGLVAWTAGFVAGSGGAKRGEDDSLRARDSGSSAREPRCRQVQA